MVVDYFVSLGQQAQIFRRVSDEASTRFDRLQLPQSALTVIANLSVSISTNVDSLFSLYEDSYWSVVPESTAAIARKLAY